MWTHFWKMLAGKITPMETDWSIYSECGLLLVSQDYAKCQSMPFLNELSFIYILSLLGEFILLTSKLIISPCIINITFNTFCRIFLGNRWNKVCLGTCFLTDRSELVEVRRAQYFFSPRPARRGVSSHFVRPTQLPKDRSVRWWLFQSFWDSLKSLPWHRVSGVFIPLGETQQPSWV